jgi:hypothetical protein
MAGGTDNNIDRVIASVGKPVEAPDMRVRETEGDLFDEPALPVPCPVIPLGVQGMKMWVLDGNNQLQCIATDCRKGDLQLLFGDSYLLRHFPQWTKEQLKKDLAERGPPDKFDQADAQSALIEECRARKIFDPQGRVFGRGAHRIGEDEEQLVLHMGSSVLSVGEADKKGKRTVNPIAYPAGRLGDRFFPALAPLPAPAEVASTTAEAMALHKLFGQWNWKEPVAAQLLLIGMVGQMFICGALSWRSHMWLSAPTTAGKSTLQKLLRAILGGWCLHTEDASEAAIRQTLKDDTLPVLIDEAEADDNYERQRAILNLLKKASSGAKMHRGAADHRAQEFTAQSCFLLSSVLHGLVKGEEWNRVAILELMPVVSTDKMWEGPDLKHWRLAGRRMHRRMIEQWPRFARTLADYKREIWTHGLEGRWQDTFGTLLACADCLLHETAPSLTGVHEEAFGREKEWVRSVLPMMTRGRSQARSDVERCISHLMYSLLPGDHGRHAETVGQWIEKAMRELQTEGGLQMGIDEAARARLKPYGLRLMLLKQGDRGWLSDGEPLPNEQGWDEGWLAIAYPTCQPLKELFKGTEWASGAWIQSLGKVEGAITTKLKPRFGGPGPENAIAIPLRALRGNVDS